MRRHSHGGSDHANLKKRRRRCRVVISWGKEKDRALDYGQNRTRG